MAGTAPTGRVRRGEVWMRLRDGDLMRQLMSTQGVTHRGLATAVGCSHGMISHLTRGEKETCTARLAHLISGALGVPTRVLFDEKVSPDVRRTALRGAA